MSDQDEAKPAGRAMRGLLDDWIEKLTYMGGVCVVNLAEPLDTDLARVHGAYLELYERCYVALKERDALAAELTQERATSAANFERLAQLALELKAAEGDKHNTKQVMDKLIANREKLIQERDELRAQLAEVTEERDKEWSAKEFYQSEAEFVKREKAELRAQLAEYALWAKSQRDFLAQEVRLKNERDAALEKLELAKVALEFVVSQSGTSSDYNFKAREVLEKIR